LNLIAGREEIWLRFIFSSWCFNPEAIGPEELEVCVRAFSQPGAVRGACNDYRAGREDVAQDQEDAEHLIECPTLVLWGEDFELGGKMWNFHEIWTKMAKQVEFVGAMWTSSSRGKTRRG
jgi:haloacetate dehalogenase